MQMMTKEENATKTIIRCPVCQLRLMDLRYPAFAIILSKEYNVPIETRCTRCKMPVGVLAKNTNNN